jgi:hypothetical protein
MAHGDAREGKRRENWRMEWVASTLHTTTEYGVSSITTADAHTSAASSRLNGRPCQFKWTRTFCRKTKSGFCACAITFQTQSTSCRCHCFAAILERKCCTKQLAGDRLPECSSRYIQLTCGLSLRLQNLTTELRKRPFCFI